MFINFKSAHESKTYRRGSITKNDIKLERDAITRVPMYKMLMLRIWFNIFFLLKKKKKRKISYVYTRLYMAVLLEEGSITLLKSRFATGVNRALIFLPPVYRTIRCANKERRREGNGTSGGGGGVKKRRA